MDPIHQFEIKNFFPIVRIGGAEIAFTNSAFFMLIGLSLILFLMLGTTRSRALVPGRLQSVAEMSYEFVANTLRSTAGTEGMKFFPLVFSLFMFILVLNVIGIIPYTFRVPSGVPIYIMPLVTFIEVLSFLSRPVSHSVRLFANMLAGHITLKVFGGFVTMLGALGFLGWLGAIVPLGLTVALTALELLVAFLQAYVFAILTCIYLSEAIHAGH